MIGRCRLAWTLWKEQCRRTELDSLLGHIGREHSVELDAQDVAARRAAQPAGVSLKGVSKTVSSCAAFSWPRQCSKTPAAGSESQIRSDVRGTGQRPGSLRPACSKPSPCFCAKRAQIHQGRHMLGHQTELRVSGSISTPGDGSVCRTKAPPKDLLSVNRRLGPI